MCGGVEGREEMAWKEGETEGEVWAGEDGEGLDEDVGHGLIAGEVWVELVSELALSVLELLLTGNE